ncbi:MAG TPA: DUF350 domain-containing protein [Spirochaetota bacterium]|nr:DUF350 domain-containing protein [Spirochaetota bacterium]HOL56971.1 DUF350 domain-containing protein [Spirochaetota bacterium]HPP04554.1 DUF350 domain-containing protein [Spirochaetota bacterium]
MNLVLLSQGLIELIISVIFGLSMFFLSFKVFSLLTKNIDEAKEISNNNVAVSILVASFIFGIMLLIKSSIGPAMETLTTVLSSKESTFIMVIIAIIRIVVFFIFFSIFAFIVLWLAIKLFTLLTTDIDEMEEIKNNNVSVSFIIATLIISMSLILSKPLETVLNGLVAPPSNTGINSFITLSVFLDGLIELGIAIVGTIFVFFLSFKIFNLLTKDIDEIKELKSNNLAISILMAAFIFAIMLIIKAAIEPANSALGFVLADSKATALTIIFVIIRIILFFILAGVIAFVVIWISMNIFVFLTKKIDEFAEIKNKNIAVAIILAILILSLAIMIDHSITAILNGLIKTPELPKDGGLIKLQPK